MIKKTISTVILLSCFGILQAQNWSTTKISQQYFQLDEQLSSEDYLSNTIIFKVKEQYRKYCNDRTVEHIGFKKFLLAVNPKKIGKIYPRHEKPIRAVNELGQPFVDLSLIYRLEYDHDIDLETAINALYKLGIVTYAEPYYVPKPFYTPNDLKTSQSAYFNVINLTKAWDVVKGDPNLIIGHIDTGIETSHPDMQDNRYINPNEIAGNGIDDDNNGYIDDVSGWDFGEDDNNPQWQGNNHGSTTVGVFGATTDNNIGIAGVAFNCKYLPIKGATSTGSLIAVWEGIPYAADMGCKVLNCSWGVPTGGAYNEDLINYATINKDCIVLAASGNEGDQRETYPAAYPNCVAVGATLNNDRKASFSVYGYHLDVMAPGSGIYTTSGTSYATQSGTSQSAPMAAGVAALIRSHYPNYTAMQAIACLKASCKNIDGITGNSSYAGKMGAGRIDAEAAVTRTDLKSAIISLPANISDGNDNMFVGGDTIRITSDFINYLNPMSNLTATLSTTNTAVTILDATTTLGAMATLEKKDNAADPFLVYIKPSAPQNTSVQFKVTLSDGAYSENYYFKKTLNVNYLTLSTNNLAFTVTSRGLLGYNEANQVEGSGLDYKEEGSVLYEASFMIGTSSSKVSSMARENTGAPDRDFISVVNIQEAPLPHRSSYDVMGTFNDDGAGSDKLNVSIDYSAYAFSFSDFVIVQYIMKNEGSSTLSNLYAGVFADWDIPDIMKNKVAEDAANKLAYAYNAAGTPTRYAGIKLLSDRAAFNHYACDISTSGGGGVDFGGGFSTAEKWTTLSTARPTAGASAGLDIGDVVSSGPYTIAPGEQDTIAFAFFIAETTNDINAIAADAQTKYSDAILGIRKNGNAGIYSAVDVFPNPAKASVNLKFTLDKAEEINWTAFDVSGKVVAKQHIGKLTNGDHNIKINTADWSEGTYFIRLEKSEIHIIKQIQLIK